MDSQPENPSLPKGEIHFPNRNRAAFIKTSSNAQAGDLIKALQIGKPKTLLVLIGGADELDKNLTSQLDQLFSRGLARAAADTEALIMDGGTEAGVMALMGKAVADRGRTTPLLGVAPVGKVTYPGGPAEGSIADGAPLDANHSHFVLVEGSEWSSGNEMMFKLANELGAGSTVIAVLVNGGPAAQDEVLRSVRQGWPIIVIEGSGRLADEIAMHWKEKEKLPPADSQMNEIVSEGNMILFPSGGSPAELRQLIATRFGTALTDAWRRFAQFDAKANSEQKRFRKLLGWSLWLGVVGTLLALAQKQLILVQQSSPPHPTGPWWWTAFLGALISSIMKLPRYWIDALYYLIILVPIVVTALLTVSNRFKPRKKWILLRGSAEGIKKETFRYRSRIGDYSDKKTVQAESPISREAVLTEKISTISQRLMQTEVNTLSLPALNGPLPPKGCVAKSDDGFSLLTPTRYLEVRLVDQLTYYGSKTRKLDRQMTQLQWAIFIIGGVGTFLAAVGAQLWIALTTALVTALTAYVGHLQIEHSLIQYNQAATDLSNVRAWWTALSTEEKAKQDNRDTLVDKSEKILESELTGWVQQMQDTMADVRSPSDDKTK